MSPIGNIVCVNNKCMYICMCRITMQIKMNFFFAKATTILDTFVAKVMAFLTHIVAMVTSIVVTFTVANATTIIVTYAVVNSIIIHVTYAVAKVIHFFVTYAVAKVIYFFVIYAVAKVIIFLSHMQLPRFYSFDHICCC